MTGAGCVWIGPLPGMPAELADPIPPVQRLPDAELNLDAAWRVLGEVLDPEVPAVSIVDLGIVRELRLISALPGRGPGLAVALTPTYSGCPATEAIAAAVRHALQASGFDAVTVELRRAPAWTTDWISAVGRQRLREAGIAPPPGRAGTPVTVTDAPVELPLRRMPRPYPQARPTATPVDCPRCQSTDTECLSAFGSTACKALYRCRACREPFEFFKPF